MVVYVPQYGEGKMWVRPLEIFLSKALLDGVEVPRFEYIGEEQPLTPTHGNPTLHPAPRTCLQPSHPMNLYNYWLRIKGMNPTANEA
jgi:hypothetical protein